VILYTDTSALVKRHIREEGSGDVLAWMRAAQKIGMSVITRAEAAATFSRLARTNAFGRLTAERLLNEFRRYWPQYIRLRVSETTIARADKLAWEHNLRGYDAVHLASAVMWQEAIDETVTLATYDRQLWAAAAQQGLLVLPETW
jgi:predicted nucleic acid-binding protein